MQCNAMQCNSKTKLASPLFDKFLLYSTVLVFGILVLLH